MNEYDSLSDYKDFDDNIYDDYNYDLKSFIANSKQKLRNNEINLEDYYKKILSNIRKNIGPDFPVLDSSIFFTSRTSIGVYKGVGTGYKGVVLGRKGHTYDVLKLVLLDGQIKYIPLVRSYVKINLSKCEFYDLLELKIFSDDSQNKYIVVEDLKKQNDESLWDDINET